MTKIMTLSFTFFKQSKLPVLMNLNSIKRNISLTHLNYTEEKVVQVQDEEILNQEKELQIESLRDKSRLKSYDRNILFNIKPHSEPKAEHHLTVKYNRKMYGIYGHESGVNPGIMWPTKADLEDRREYEKVAFPHTIQELIKSAEEEIRQRELKTQQEHDRVVANMVKLKTWKKELKEKIAKKEAEALAVKEKKEKLIEEVRRHFGYTVDPRDERFKEMLVVKEKEQKKLEKQARIEEKTKKALAKLMSKHEASTLEQKNVDGNS